MSKYYHVTYKRNFEKINKSMKLVGNRNMYCIYACRDLRSVIEFAKEKVKAGKIKYDEVVIFEFESKTPCVDSFDHVAKYHNNATAVKFNEDVTIDSLEIVEVNEDWKKIFKENLIPSNIVIEKDMEEIR